LAPNSCIVPFDFYFLIYLGRGYGMKLQGDGIHIELAIEGYQFGAIIDDWWDANWLVVRGRVETPDGTWNFRNACLTTFELQQLALWFDRVAERNAEAESIDFTEPNVGFEFLPQPQAVIRVRFAYESAPSWATDRGEGAMLTVPVALNEPRLLATRVREWLRNFPVRGKREDTE
jgi:hypothetical protein